MSKLIGPLAKVMFSLFMLGVFAGVTYYSWRALGMIFPGDLAGQSFGMTLFDMAALVWFLVFVKLCFSTMQYVFSAIGFMLGIAGTLGLVGIEVGISSGLLDAATMAEPLTYIFIAALVGHLLLIYARHAAAPELSADISFGVERARITDQAKKDAEQVLANNQNILAAPIAAEYVRRVMLDLGLESRGGDVIELKAVDVAKPEQNNRSGMVPDFLSRILSGWGNGARKFESSVTNVSSSSQPSTPTPSPAAENAGPGAGEENSAKL